MGDGGILGREVGMESKDAEDTRKAAFDFLSSSLKGLFLLNGVACTALLASKNLAFLFSIEAFAYGAIASIISSWCAFAYFKRQSEIKNGEQKWSIAFAIFKLAIDIFWGFSVGAFISGVHFFIKTLELIMSH